MIVTKFGGSSLADAKQFQKVREIIDMDSRRVFVVPSAPGRRFDGDDKVTDLLYKCYKQCLEGMSYGLIFSVIRERYLEIAEELHLSIDISKYLDDVEMNIADGASADYCASRGEFLNGLLLADFLGYDFIDSKDVIFFREDGSFDDEKTNDILGNRLKNIKAAVIPGFYGSLPDGSIKTFSRGGSDITGAIVARAAKADVYENWTDVSGFLMADPRIVPNAQPISHITYHEMHELSCAGATVLHEDSVLPVSRSGIPTNIRNTNNPEHPGTLITCTAVKRENFAIFAGVAGKRGFSLILAEKNKPDSSHALAKSIFEAVRGCGLKFKYLPSGVNNVCLMVNTEELQCSHGLLSKRISNIEIPHSFTIYDNLALISLVGYGITHKRETIVRIYDALRRNNINIHMLNQGSSELSTWIGVEEEELENAITSIYNEFVEI